MQKQAPTLGRLAVMVGFTLSCFGLLLFLWNAFGGPIPLKPKGYRYEVAIPAATQLAQQADVRMAGVSIGKVVASQLDPRGNRTLATVQLANAAAPISSTSRVMLRQKTLLGETYLDVTPGRPGSPKLREGSRLPDAQVKPSVQLDQIFTALDPATRRAFHTWQQTLARGVRGRETDLSDALGNLPGFAVETGGAVHSLRRVDRSLHDLVANTGVVFAALTHDQRALRDLITNSAAVFSATASQNRALAESFRIFPTFLDESRSTLARLKSFAVDTHPLIRELRPAAHDLPPTVRSARLLAPDLRETFTRLDPLIAASKRGLPALRDTLRGAQPLLSSLGPFLEQLNPVLNWLELYQHAVSDFAGGFGGRAIAARSPAITGGTGHYLRQLTLLGPETLSIYTRRSPTNRGNAYFGPLGPYSVDTERKGIFPNWDCKPSGGEVTPQNGPSGHPACFVAPPTGFQGSAGHYSHVQADHYGGR